MRSEDPIAPRDLPVPMRSEYLAELHKRVIRLLEQADWDDIVLDRITVGHFRFREVDDYISVEWVEGALIIYRAHERSGRVTNWISETLPEVLHVLRQHMVLQDLADV